MAIPNIADLIVFMGTPLSASDWLANWTQVVNWLTDGTADLNVKSINITGFQSLPKYVDSDVSGITDMTEGSMIMNITTHRPMFYDGQTWQTL